MGEMNDVTPNLETVGAEAGLGEAAENPLLRELGAQIEQRARQAADEAAAQAAERVRHAAQEAEGKTSWMSEESFRKWKEEFEQAQSAAHEQLSAQQNDLLSRMRSEFNEGVSQAKRLIEEIERNREALHAENEAGAEAASRLAQSRLQIEALEAERASQASAEAQEHEFPLAEEAMTKWRQRMQSEMSAAQQQWNELLQSSLDSGVKRIAGQLSERSQEIGRQAELGISSRFDELRQPLLKTLGETQETLAGIKNDLDQELARAKASLAEIEESATRINDLSTHVEVSTRDVLNELNHRLQSILDAQTQEMGERAEAVTARASEKAAAALDALREKCVQRSAAEIEAKIATHLERVPQILHELSNREVQMEEGLRLHRERLRQLSENSERELQSRLNAAAAEARGEFEAARQEAATRWGAELEASGARASHAAAESIEKASQSLEREARGRLQTMVEQTLAEAGTSFDTKIGEGKQAFAAALETESLSQVEKIRQQLDGATTELTARGRTQIEQAAEVTATAFGQVMRGISDQEVERFSSATVNVMQGRTQELEDSAAQLLRNLETGAESSLTQFCTQMASHLETTIAAGRDQLASEFTSVLAGYQSQRDAHQKDWLEHLGRLSDEAAGRHQERLDMACDSWMVSSVRRLNEHGQNVIEALMRSADQAMRDSCARFFDGLAETLRERPAGFAPSSHAKNAAREAAEAVPPPATESGLNQSSL